MATEFLFILWVDCFWPTNITMYNHNFLCHDAHLVSCIIIEVFLLLFFPLSNFLSHGNYGAGDDFWGWGPSRRVHCAHLEPLFGAVGQEVLDMISIATFVTKLDNSLNHGNYGAARWFLGKWPSSRVHYAQQESSFGSVGQELPEIWPQLWVSVGTFRKPHSLLVLKFVISKFWKTTF